MTYKTLVYGASTKPERYSYKAIKMLQEYGHEVVAIGGRTADLDGTPILTGHPELEDIHTITMYMGEARQADHVDYILGLDPKRIIFNPGAENMSLYLKAERFGNRGRKCLYVGDAKNGAVRAWFWGGALGMLASS